MPVDSMTADSSMVMAFLLDIPFGFQLNFKSFSLALSAGPAFNFRIPLWGDGDTQSSEMSSYFMEGGKFFNLSAGFFFFIPISDMTGMTLKGDTWLPMYNLWTDNDLPFSDGLMVTVSAGFRFTF